MPAPLKSTSLLLVLLGITLVATCIGTFQKHSAESSLTGATASLSEANRTMTQVAIQLRAGVTGEDPYAAALEDDDNILQEAQQQLVDPDAPIGGTLRRLLTSDPAGFNWLVENSADVQEIQDYVHNQFARPDFDEPDNWTPELAYKVETNEDFTEYTVHLREGVYWQRPNISECDGLNRDWLRERRELTAEDAVFYFEMAMNPEVQAAHVANYVNDIDEVEQLDRYTFRVTWEESVYHSMFTVLGGYPLPKWLYERDVTGETFAEENIPAEFNSHWSNDCPIGTGPYTFESFRAGDRVALGVNRDYWDITPPIEEIEFHIIPDPEAGWNQVLGGNIDFLPSLAPPRYRGEILNPERSGCGRLRGTSPFEDGALEYEVIDRFVYYYIGWNADEPLFEDRRVRKAMTRAFNRQGIIDNVLHGLGELQSGPYYHDHPANNPDIEPIEFDLDRAEELLEEAGWTDMTGDGIRNKEIDGELHDFEFTLTSYNRPIVRSWTSIFSEDLRSIGIEMNIDPVDWALMQRRMEEKNFDAFTGGWALSWYIDPYQIWHSSQADVPRGSNRVGFRNDDADAVIEELRSTFDPEKRQELLHELHAIIHGEQAYTFFYAPKEVAVWNPRLNNVVFQQIRPQTYSLPWSISTE